MILVILISRNSVIASYEDSSIYFDIYANGEINGYYKYEDDLKLNNKISEDELKELERLISVRAIDEIAINEDTSKNEELVQQGWWSVVYFDGNKISLNYNFAKTNLEVQSYIDMINNKYLSK